MSIGKQASLSAAFSASRVPYQDRLFVVGPFASRVSFASQQRRALSLVTSVHEDLIKSGEQGGLKGQNIAVIGGGLAGLTTAVACACHGASIWIFEKSEKVLSQFERAMHRDIHPTINFWPIEELEPTTFLPFFNWWQAPCNEVISKINSEWSYLREKFNVEIMDVLEECGVKSVASEEDKWKLQFEADAKDPPKGALFDCVFVATGFGVERKATNSDTCSYWIRDNDHISRVRTMQSPPFDKYVVSGGGDGAVIEILRLLFKNFRAGSVEANTGPILSSEKIASEVKRIESTVRKEVSDAILHQSYPIQNKLEIANELSRRLWTEYVELVTDWQFGKANRERLLEPDVRTSIDKVYHLGLLDTPIEHQVSPYHKLLLAIAVTEGLVEYHSYDGELDVEDGQEHMVPDLVDFQQHAIIAKNLKFVTQHRISDQTNLQPEAPETEDDSKRDWENCLYVSRHGYHSPIEDMFDDEEVANRIRRRQSLYADHDSLTLEQADMYTKACGYGEASDSKAWAARHKKDAELFFREHYGVAVKIVTETRDVFTDVGRRELELKGYRVYTDGEPFKDDLFSRTEGILPSHFYGVEVFEGVDRVDTIDSEDSQSAVSRE